MGDEPRKKNKKKAGKKKKSTKARRVSGGSQISTRLGRGRPLSDEEIARRQADDRKVLRDEPVLIGYSGPKPRKGMHFEVQRWDTVTHGWSHECYARTEADAKVQGRQRLGTFGHRWRVKQLFRRAGRRGRGGSQGGRTRNTGAERGRGGGHRTVTGYDPSVPRPRDTPAVDPDRTQEEIELAELIESICRGRARAKPARLGMMRQPQLLEWLERLSIVSEEGPSDELS